MRDPAKGLVYIVAEARLSALPGAVPKAKKDKDAKADKADKAGKADKAAEKEAKVDMADKAPVSLCFALIEAQSVKALYCNVKLNSGHI